MTPSLGDRVRSFSHTLSAPTSSDVVHIRTLRKAIGGIALALPAVLVIGENIRDALLTSVSNAAYIEASISAYFHTGMRELFVGSLCAVGVFLLCYKGYERRDDLAANAAGLALIVVALFPTFEKSREAGDAGVPAPDSVTLFSDASAPDPSIVGSIHFFAAALFFLVIAAMSLWLFTRTADPRTMTDRKRQRNVVYRACGWAIVACIVVIVIGKIIVPSWTEGTFLVFICETIAVMAFGVSWLTKAEVILADRPEDSGRAAATAV